MRRDISIGDAVAIAIAEGIEIIEDVLPFTRDRLTAQGWTWKLSGWIGPDGRFVAR